MFRYRISTHFDTIMIECVGGRKKHSKENSLKMIPKKHQLSRMNYCRISMSQKKCQANKRISFFFFFLNFFFRTGKTTKQRIELLSEVKRIEVSASPSMRICSMLEQSFSLFLCFSVLRIIVHSLTHPYGFHRICGQSNFRFVFIPFDANWRDKYFCGQLEHTVAVKMIDIMKLNANKCIRRNDENDFFSISFRSYNEWFVDVQRNERFVCRVNCWQHLILLQVESTEKDENKCDFNCSRCLWAALKNV